MLSPFPGMNPYLETPELWGDFHAAVAYEIRVQLTPRLRPRYTATLVPRIEVNEIFIQETTRSIYPDVAILRPREPQGGGMAVLDILPAPLTGRVLQEEFRVYRIEIRRTESGQLVTAIEILSPTNKRPGSESLAAYRRKRLELRLAGVALLEVDLLRVGERLAIQGGLPHAPYFVFLNRGGEEVEIWPLPLGTRLPVVPVPLLQPDPDIPLDLDAALNAVYAGAAYDLSIDYSQPPPNAETLSSAELAWLRSAVQAD